MPATAEIQVTPQNVSIPLIAALITRILRFHEALSGHPFYAYQYVFSYRIIEALLTDDDAERLGSTITGLWSRQCLLGTTVVLDRDGMACQIKDHPRAWKTGTRQVYRLTAQSGQSVVATDNHPFKTPTGWKRLDELKAGDLVATLKRWESPEEFETTGTFKHRAKGRTTYRTRTFSWNVNRGKLLGYLTADGYALKAIQRGQSVKFTNITKKFLVEVERLVEQEFPDVHVKWYPKGKGYDLLLVGNHGIQGQNSLRQWLFGMREDSHFPTAIFTAPRDVKIAFLNRLFAADGCASRNSIQLSCGNSRVFASYAQLLLNEMGVTSQIKPERMTKGTGVFFRLDISRKDDLARFLAAVGHIYGKEAACSRLDVDLTRWSNVLQQPCRAGVDGEELVYVRVRSIKPLKKKHDVYDIEYPGKGWFVANGLVVHNSGKTSCVAELIITLAVLLPVLAKLLPQVECLQKFVEGLRVAIFAPIDPQAKLSYDKMRELIGTERAKAILADESIDVSVLVSRGDQLTFSNGSQVIAKSASPDSSIEGISGIHIILIDEAQGVDAFKVDKEIEPMRAATNGVMVKIGTASFSRGGFREDIESNIAAFRAGLSPRNHFEFPYDQVIRVKAEMYRKTGKKIHLAYARYVEGQKKKMGGEKSPAFRMNFMLKWQESRMDAVSDRALNAAKELHRSLNVEYPREPNTVRVAGIDVAKGTNDPTVVTINEFDPTKPIIIKDEQTGDEVKLYHHTFIAIKEFGGNFEDLPDGSAVGQYSEIIAFLHQWDVVRCTVDATALGDPVYQRFSVLATDIDWEPYRFSRPTKSDLYKYYLQEWEGERLHVYSGDQDLLQWQKFFTEHKTLQKTVVGESGQFIKVAAPKSKLDKRLPGEKAFHDDYPDSAALAVWATRGELMMEIQSDAGTGYTKTRSQRPSVQERYGGRR